MNAVFLFVLMWVKKRREHVLISLGCACLPKLDFKEVISDSFRIKFREGLCSCPEKQAAGGVFGGIFYFCTHSRGDGWSHYPFEALSALSPSTAS